jgi:6-pyruvoyl tetrahydropterin synthase
MSLSRATNSTTRAWFATSTSYADAVTVEVFARWVHDQLRSALPADGATLQVRVWETPEAFGGYTGVLG